MLYMHVGNHWVYAYRYTANRKTENVVYTTPDGGICVLVFVGMDGSVTSVGDDETHRTWQDRLCQRSDD